MKSALASIALLLTSTIAYADGLIIHGISRHSHNNHTWSEQFTNEYGETIIRTHRAFNNLNYGVGYRTDGGYIVGTYKNSYYLTTVYAGKEFMYNEYIGVFLAGATGYKKQSGYTVTPFATLMLKAPITDKTKLMVNIVPKKKLLDYEVISAAVQYDF